MPHYSHAFFVVFDRCSDTVVATRFELIFHRLQCGWVIRQKVLLFALDTFFLTRYNKYNRGIKFPHSLTNAELWGFLCPKSIVQIIAQRFV